MSKTKFVPLGNGLQYVTLDNRIWATVPAIIESQLDGEFANRYRRSKMKQAIKPLT